jgi:hypothetical protein
MLNFSSARTFYTSSASGNALIPSPQRWPWRRRLLRKLIQHLLLDFNLFEDQGIKDGGIKPLIRPERKLSLVCRNCGEVEL